LRARRPRHVVAHLTGPLRRRPDAARSRLHEHRGGARGDDRPIRGGARPGRPDAEGAARVTELDALAAAARGGRESAGGEFVLLGFPDVNGSIRGKALRPAAFEAAVRDGAVVTDLLLALDPTDTPITDYERFGIRSRAGDIIVRPEPDTL